VGEDAEVMLLSDHGSGGTSDRVVFWNRWLADNGWLTFAGPSVLGAATAVRRAALRWIPTRLQPRLFSSLSGLAGRLESNVRLGGIDWSRTRAFSEEVNYYPAIWLNLRGREPQGVVDPAEEDEVLTELAADLETFVDPFDGERVVEKVIRREELFDGPWAGRAPDLVLALREPDGYSYACASSRGGLERTRVRRLRSAERRGERGTSMPGSHRQDGLCVLRSRRVRPGRFPRAELADAGASLLALMGSAVPRGADGRVWWDCFREPAREGLRAAGAPTGRLEGSDAPYSDAEESEVADKLRALGYMD